MEGGTSQRGRRRVLVVERGWKFHRQASQCQAQAYRQVVPERSVIVRSVAIAWAGVEAGEHSSGRVAAGGRS